MISKIFCKLLKVKAEKEIFLLLVSTMLFVNPIPVYGANGEIKMQSVDYEKEFMIRKGETVEFSDGLKLKFLGHSHKTVMTGGPASPLIVSLEYELKGINKFNTYNVHPGEKETWSWQGRYFHLVDYEYDSTMKLKVGHTSTMRSVGYDSEFFIRRGETVTFPDGFKFTFNSFSTGIMGLPPSVNVNYQFNGEEEAHISDVDKYEGDSWNWEDRIFYVVDSKNSLRIKLRVVGNIPGR